MCASRREPQIQSMKLTGRTARTGGGRPRAANPSACAPPAGWRTATAARVIPRANRDKCQASDGRSDDHHDRRTFRVMYSKMCRHMGVSCSSHTPPRRLAAMPRLAASRSAQPIRRATSSAGDTSAPERDAGVQSLRAVGVNGSQALPKKLMIPWRLRRLRRPCVRWRRQKLSVKLTNLRVAPIESAT